MEPGFAQWPMVGRQKTPGINYNKRGSDWLEGKMFVVGRVRQWGGCPDREVVLSVLRGSQGQARQNPQQPGVTLLWTKEH